MTKDNSALILNKFSYAGLGKHPLQILRNAMACRNERYLYARKCSFSGESIISAYSADTPFPVIKNELWWGDSWDASEYFLELNLNLSFLEQFKALQNQVPREGTSVFNSANCAYNSHIRGSRNCYLCSLVIDSEDCHCSYWTVRNKDVCDCFFVLDSELCYECVKCKNCYDCVCVHESNNSNGCYFSYQLHGCENCLFCSNLSNKKYHIFNKSVSKEDFLLAKAEIFDGSYQSFHKALQQFNIIRKENFHRSLFNINCENCLGDSLQNCKNCYHCFIGEGSEDCHYSTSLNFAKDVYSSYAINVPGENQLIYGSSVIRGCHNVICSYYLWQSQDMLYCDSCVSCSHCFGCVGLRHKNYCIFNKQYDKKTYFENRKRLIELMQNSQEWGQIPVGFSTFAYNQTAAQEYMPLSESEASRLGFGWREEPETLKSDKVTPFRETVQDLTGAEVFSCQRTGRLYRLQKSELEFYKKMNLPPPRQHPDSRHNQRMSFRTSTELHDASCLRSNAQIITTVPPSANLSVVSEEEYVKEVFA